MLQLLSYIVRIWEKRSRGGAPLCPIVPLIVYHGDSGWSAARSLSELVPAPAGLAPYAIYFQPRLLDLSQLTNDEIRGVPILQGTLRLLKYSRSKHLMQELAEVLRMFARASLPDALLTQWIKAIGIYVMSANNNIDSEQYEQTLKSVFPTQFEAGSLADRLLTQGREEGLVQGKLAGQIQLLEQLLGK